jgi:hypothetical protein
MMAIGDCDCVRKRKSQSTFASICRDVSEVMLLLLLLCLNAAAIVGELWADVISAEPYLRVHTVL